MTKETTAKKTTTKKPVALPKNDRIYMPEFLELLGKTRAKKDRQELITQYRNKNSEHEQLLRVFVECMWHPKVEFALPPQSPPFNRNDAPDYALAGQSLFKVIKRIGGFIKCPGMIQNVMKREQNFIQVLESVFPAEADLLIAMKDKDISKYKNIDRDLFYSVLPHEWFGEKVLNLLYRRRDMSEFGIKEIERLAAAEVASLKFYSRVRFILSGFVVFAISMIYIMYKVPESAFWIGMIGWICLIATLTLDLLATNAAVLSQERKLRILGFNNKNENDNC